MKVILVQDVKKLGKKDSVVNVSDGYAMNFLFPRNLAVKVSERSLEIKTEQEEARRDKLAQRKADAEVVKHKIEALQLEVTARAGKDGKMFGSISTKQMVEELKTKHKIVIDKKKILHSEPISVFGITVVKIQLEKGVIASLSVQVKEQA